MYAIWLLKVRIREQSGISNLLVTTASPDVKAKSKLDDQGDSDGK